MHFPRQRFLPGSGHELLLLRPHRAPRSSPALPGGGGEERRRKMYFVPSKNKAEEVRCSHAPWRAMHVCESTRGCNKTPFSLSLPTPLRPFLLLLLLHPSPGTPFPDALAHPSPDAPSLTPHAHPHLPPLAATGPPTSTQQNRTTNYRI